MTVAVSWPTMLLYAFALVLLLGVGAHGFVWKLTLPGPVPISGSDATYPTTPYRTLVGHSYRGLFNVNTLLQRPELFARSNSCLR